MPARHLPDGLPGEHHPVRGGHGVGRIDIMEDRMLGLKVRENYECPAATVLLTAHRALEALVLTREELAFKKIIDQKWGEMAYAGLWLDPLKDDLEAFIASRKRSASTAAAPPTPRKTFDADDELQVEHDWLSEERTAH